MNATTKEYIPSDSIVDSNLGFAITLSILASFLVGVVLLPVLLLKKLRSQPYQFLVSNYLAALLAIVCGSGIYRVVQIARYKSEGYESTMRDANCIVASFFEFPFVVSTYSFFLIGLERFIYLRSKPRMPIDWCTLFIFIITPWALGITRYSVYLGDNSSRYENIPYLGFCIDITSERDGRRIVHFIFDIVIPILLATVAFSLAIARTYSDYSEVTARLTYDLESERAQLEEDKRQVLKVIRELYLPITLFVMKLLSIIILTLLFREYGNDDNSQEHRDATGTAGIVLLLFEPCLVSVVFFCLNFDLRREMLIYIPIFRSPLVSPNVAEDPRDDGESVDTAESGDATESDESDTGSNVVKQQPPDVTAVKENVTTTAI